MMTTQTGKLLYISDNAAEYLGHSMVSLVVIIGCLFTHFYGLPYKTLFENYCKAKLLKFSRADKEIIFMALNRPQSEGNLHNIT